MAKRIYEPPRQGGTGMIVDSIFLLMLVYAALLVPLVVDFGGEQVVEIEETEVPTWESLGQNATMAAQWEKLGMGPEEAAEIINTRFDYTIDPWALIGTALVIIVYFVFLLRVSDRQYREVIAEKFDP